MPRVLVAAHAGKASCCSACSLDQRVQLLRRGLGEREPAVQKEAIIMVQVWLEEKRTCNWDPIKLLQLLDVQTHEGSQVFGSVMELINPELFSSCAMGSGAGGPVAGWRGAWLCLAFVGWGGVCISLDTLHAPTVSVQSHMGEQC